MKNKLLLVVGLFLCGSAWAGVNPLFRDHMVFPAGKTLRVFGTGTDSAKVRFLGHEASAACKDGRWLVELPAAEAGGPYELEIECDGVKTVVKDVWVGEVILLAGQSNMQFRLDQDTSADEPHPTNVLLRSYMIDRLEKHGMHKETDGWVVATPEAVRRWSAIGYLLGSIRTAQKKVAVGLVNCYQGASTIQAWMPKALAEDARFALPPGGKLHADDSAPAYAAWNRPWGKLYEAMFSKAVPFSFSHVVWYQGESNTGHLEGTVYADRLVAMIDRWRADLRDPALPFTLVQIADFKWRQDDDWRSVQAAQLTVPLRMKGVKTVRSADISDHDIHPSSKQPLAVRISDAMDGSVALPADKQLIYDSIFAPTEVAFQPDDSARDLVQLPDGEIRHYGRKLVAGEVRRAYIASRDLGLNWELRLASTNEPPAYPKLPWPDLEPRPPITLRQRRPGRLVMACSNVNRTNDCYHAALAWSDDGGKTWRRSEVPRTPDVARRSQWDLKPHWFNDGCEPSVAELSDGTLLMALRTSGPHLAFSRSSDGGETWSVPQPDPRFWQANTMPCLLKLKDGRLLMVWNNTELLPTRAASEYPELGRDELNGKWETVFTNRDAVHAAISEDDGKTWIGFREVLLNAYRNEADFRELGNAPDMRRDKSVHQPQLLELPGGKVMLAVGQNLPRRILVFDLKWLYERGRETDFRHGLRDVSSFLYVKSLSGGWRGWAGHCAWNRTPGPFMEKDPFDPKSVRELVHLCRMDDPRLVSARQGLVWNFPAMRKGRVEIECRVEGEGFRASVLDHWVNPCDERSDQVAVKTVRVTKVSLGDGWQTVTVDWDLPEGQQASYLHLQTLADGPDAKGAYFRSLKALSEEK